MAVAFGIEVRGTVLSTIFVVKLSRSNLREEEWSKLDYCMMHISVQRPLLKLLLGPF